MGWSNWDGVGDATASIQMQRGLSAVNLATPSIGGTMNIITDPTALERGGKLKQEIGAAGFVKTTLNYNTGLMMGDKLALSTTLVKKTGDGLIDAMRGSYNCETVLSFVWANLISELCKTPKDLFCWSTKEDTKINFNSL